MKFLFLFFFLLTFFNVAPVSSSRPTYAKQKFADNVSKIITVDINGKGDFTTVQSAIDSVPYGNSQWIKIHVTTGEYREQVVIPKDKGYLFIEGEGINKTVLVSSKYAPPDPNQASDADFQLPRKDLNLTSTATFTSKADNIVVKYLSIKNDYNADNMPIRRAIAALISGDKTSFYSCSFIALQDTLCDYLGRHYYYMCTIEGAIDFIFGYAQSFYEKCIINSNTKRLGKPGWITAQGRFDPKSPEEFVFKHCVLKATGDTFLGRAWGPYSRVIYFMSYMTGDIVPQGWDSWGQKETKNIDFAEEDCIGPGANTSGRVTWLKKYGPDELKRLINYASIDPDGWIKSQP